MITPKLASRLLILTLVFGFLVRLYAFSNPIADWHSWRQADTSAVSRNFINFGFDLLHPRFDDLSNVPSGIDNPKGYRFVEFPLYNVAQAVLFKLVGILTLEQWGRIVSILASLVGSFFLYKLTSKYSGNTAGIAAAFFYTFLPYNIYFSRTILPDPSMAAMIIGGIYFFDMWLEIKTKSWRLFLLTFLFTAAAVLLKPYALFYGLVFLALAYSTYGFGLAKQWKLWLLAILSVAPFVAWRLWMQQFPEGIPASSWLFNSNGIRFRPAFFRWLGFERLTKLISGYAGLILFVVGLYQVRYEKQKLFYISFGLSALLYLVVFATGNVQHDYYQIVVMPVVATFFGLGTKWLVNAKIKKEKQLRIALFVIITLIGFFMSWQQVKDFFNINNHSIVVAGEAVDRLIPKDAKVLAIYNGDTAFLYQTKRQGWASFEKPIPEMVQMGADYLVFAHPNQSELDFAKEYQTVAKTEDYVIYNLHKKP